MVKIKRYEQYVIVYDEEKRRGITFPVSETVNIDQYVEELRKIADSDEIEAGLRVIPLVFDSFYEVSYRPIKEFLEDKDSAYLDDDEHAKELYEFYFQHSMPQVSPGSVDYIYLGKEYHSGVEVTMC